MTEDVMWDKFLKRLDELVEKRGIALYAVMVELGFNVGTAYHWKGRRYMPRRLALILLADYFNVSVDYLLGRTNKKKKFNQNQHASSAFNIDYLILNSSRTQKTISKESGVSEFVLCQLKNNNYFDLRMITIVKLADYFKVSADCILGLVDVREEQQNENR